LEKKKYCISVPIIMKKCIIVETDNLQETLAKVKDGSCNGQKDFNSVELDWDKATWKETED